VSDTEGDFLNPSQSALVSSDASTNRIDDVFLRLRQTGRGGFIPFITAGDPDGDSIVPLIFALERAGADIIELGVGFSDPVADGLVIQQSSERALSQGVGLREVLAAVAQARRETETAIVLFSYFNPLLQYGLERLAADAARAGVDGVLVTDLTPEAGETFTRHLRAHNLHNILLVAPTTSDARLRLITARASGFIYAVSRAGVTGARGEMSNDAENLVRRLRAVTDLPVAVGFGISTPEHVAQVWSYADAAVVGSAIVREIGRCGASPALVEEVELFAKQMLPAGTLENAGD
jgi:tryptophan synthase alpha chain